MKLFGALCVAGIMTMSASAGTIFDNTGYTIAGQDGIAASGTDANGNTSHGPIYESFSTITSANLTGFTLNSVGVNLSAGDNTDGGVIDVGLYSSPGTLISNLGTFSDSQLLNCASSSGECTDGGTLVTLSGLSAQLSDNTTYWIGLVSDATNPTSALWNYNGDDSGVENGTSPITGEYENQYGYNPDSNGAYIMQISTTDNGPLGPTPEPASLALLGGGALVIGLFRRKIKSN